MAFEDDVGGGRNRSRENEENSGNVQAKMMVIWTRVIKTEQWRRGHRVFEVCFRENGEAGL